MEIALSKDKTKIQITQGIKEVPVGDYVNQLISRRDMTQKELDMTQARLDDIQKQLDAVSNLGVDIRPIDVKIAELKSIE